MDDASESTKAPICAAELKELSAAANQGDMVALEKLRRLLEETPAIWKCAADLSSTTRRKLGALIGNGDRVVMESLRLRLAEFRDSLGWSNASTVTQLAIDSVLTCWMQSQLADRMILAAEPASKPAQYWLRYRAQADRAYRLGLKDLATLQRLMSGSGRRVVPPHQPTVRTSPCPQTAESIATGEKWRATGS